MMNPLEFDINRLKENSSYLEEWLENLDKYMDAELTEIREKLEYLETEIEKLKKQLKVK